MSREIIFKAVLEDGEFKAKLDSLSQSAEGADASINELQSATKSLGNQLKSGAGITEFNKATEQSTVVLSKQVNELKEVNVELKNEASTLKGLKKESDSVGKAKTSLIARTRQLKEQLVELELAGKRDTAQFRALSLEAAKLNDAIGDVAQRTKALASDTSSFDAFAEGIQGIAGGFAAAQGFAALFGAENEEVEKALLKVQASLAIVNGLQAVFNTLNKNSAFLTIATAKANTIAAAAFRLLGVSVTATSTAFKVLRGVIIGLGIGAIFAAIGFITEFFSDTSEEADNAADSVDNFNSKLKEIEKTSKAINDALADSALDLAVATGTISKVQAENIKNERALNEQIQDRINLTSELLGVQISSSKQAQNALRDALSLGIPTSGPLAAQAKAAQQLLKDIDALEAESENRKRIRAIETQKKITAATDAEVRKRLEDEAKALELFRSLFLKEFNESLGEEEKLIAESNEKKLALRTAFEALSNEERIKQQSNFEATILLEEEKLLNKIKELRLRKETEAAQAVLDARVTNLNSKGLELELAAIRSQGPIINRERLANANKLAEQESALNKQRFEAEALQRELNNENIFAINQDLNNKIAIEDERLKQQLKANNEAYINSLRETVQLGFQALSEFVSLIFSNQSARIQNELTNLNKQRDDALKNFKGSEQQRLRIEEQFAARERAIKRRQAQAEKDEALYQIAINTAVAVSRAIGQPGAAIQIPFILALSAIQAAAVISRPLPEFGEGGWISGAPHSRGGVPLVAEGEEFIVKKAAAKKHAGFLEALNRNDGSFERMIFHNFVMPELLNLKDNNIVVNSVFKSERIERELKRTRKIQQAQNELILNSLNQNNQPNKRSIWLN